jgi:hypothetical protein
MLGDIDLNFGIWVYSDELQIKFTFRSSPMIFGRVNFGPWTLKFGQIFSCHHFFSLCLEILSWFLVYDLWVYNDELQIKFTFRSGPMTFGWVMVLELKFGQIFSCHHFFSRCLVILTWFLAYECIMMNYRSSLHFVPVQWFLIKLIMALGLWNLAKYLVVSTFFRYAWRYWPDFWYMTYECIMMSYRSSLHFVPVQWFLVELWPLDFEIWPNI